MAKPELGLKRVCVSCTTRFFDLMKSPAICPKCGTEQPADAPRLRRGGNPIEERKVKKPPVAEDAEAETEAETGDEETEEGVLEDASDLEDDADAISGDIEVEPDNDERER